MTTTLYRGGRVYCPAEPTATALVIEDNLIAWVGSDGLAAAHVDDVDRVVSLDGTLVAPAFVDAHVHTTSTGLNLTGLDLSDVRSGAELLERLAAHAATAEGTAILGHRWDESGWPDPTLPTRTEIDRAAKGAVVYLSRIDVHSCLASSALIDQAPQARVLSGYTDRGWLSQDAHHAVRAVAFESITPEQRRSAQRTALDRAASLGIAMVHELGGPGISDPEDFRELLAYGAAAGTPEVVGYWGERGGPEIALSLGAVGAAGDLFIDGAIGSHTALLREPYSDEDTRGAQYVTAAEIRDHIQACSLRGVQAGFHVIGDGAMDVLCAALREAAANVGTDVVRAARHRLEHVEMVTAEQLLLFVELGIVASVQPLFDELWGGESGMYVTRLGKERAAALNPFASMLANGIPMAFGSDAPVTPLGPWEAIRAAAQHHNADSAINVRAGFHAHTRGGWHAAGLDVGGVIAPGQPASLAFWATDAIDATSGLPVLEADAPVPTCLQTIVNGRTVFTLDR